MATVFDASRTLFRPDLYNADTPRLGLPSLRARFCWMDVVEKGAEMAGIRKDGGRVAARKRGALKTPLSTVLHVQCIVGAGRMGM